MVLYVRAFHYSIASISEDPWVAPSGCALQRVSAVWIWTSAEGILLSAWLIFTVIWLCMSTDFVNGTVWTDLESYGLNLWAHQHSCWCFPGIIFRYWEWELIRILFGWLLASWLSLRGNALLLFVDLCCCLLSILLCFVALHKSPAWAAALVALRGF